MREPTGSGRGEGLNEVAAPAIFRALMAALSESEASSCEELVGRSLDDVENLSSIQLRLAFSRLGRKCSSEITVSPGECVLWEGLSSPRFFSTDVIARVGFLLGLSERMEQCALLSAVTTLYRTGSEGEQVSVLRALPWLPAPEQFDSLAREACRTNDVRVFSALAIENPYLTRHLPDEALFQWVLKAMFLEVDTRDMLGLGARINSELVRWISDFAAERRAAGRPVPEDALAILDHAKQ